MFKTGASLSSGDGLVTMELVGGYFCKIIETGSNIFILRPDVVRATHSIHPVQCSLSSELILDQAAGLLEQCFPKFRIARIECWPTVANVKTPKSATTVLHTEKSWRRFSTSTTTYMDTGSWSELTTQHFDGSCHFGTADPLVTAT